MGIAFLHGNGGSGGGSGGLELTVVGGTTRPAKPTQNMIWVDTEHEITSYVFSATQPDAPVEGMLWLKIDDSGNIKIPSPVGKDWITVYPLDPEQYVDGAWIGRTTMCYQDCEWIALFSKYLYNKGDQCTTYTGGWENHYQGNGASNVSPAFNSDHIYVKTGSSQVTDIITKKPVNLTGISKLYITIEDATFGKDTSMSRLVLFISTGNNSSGDSIIARTDFRTSNAELNVASYDGEHYITVSAGYSVECKITSITWERG